MPTLRVYVLRFDCRTSLTRAFDRVLVSPEVESCMIEAEHTRIRFLAPAKEAEALVERIYRDGGLLWCSRHELSESP